jgi:copper chaperone NosL
VRNPIILLVVIFFVSAGSPANPLDPGAPQKARCPVCHMFVSMFPDWNARIEFKDSTAEILDGSKCMFKYYLDMGKCAPSKDRQDLRTIAVKDYSSKTDIDAREAFYVIWGDVYGPMGHEPIAFQREAGAEKFLKEHKGREILRFGNVSEDIITYLDHP